MQACTGLISWSDSKIQSALFQEQNCLPDEKAINHKTYWHDTLFTSCYQVRNLCNLCKCSPSPLLFRMQPLGPTNPYCNKPFSQPIKQAKSLEWIPIMSRSTYAKMCIKWTNVLSIPLNHNAAEKVVSCENAALAVEVVRLESNLDNISKNSHFQILEIHLKQTQP